MWLLHNILLLWITLIDYKYKFDYFWIIFDNIMYVEKYCMIIIVKNGICNKQNWYNMIFEWFWIDRIIMCAIKSKYVHLKLIY
jgi:hypothetical protein